MNLEQIENEYASIENLHFRVSVMDTMANLGVGESTFVLFRDASPNSIRTTATRIANKKFTITEKGYMDRTFIRRKS
jgi:hypothetical protein